MVYARQTASALKLIKAKGQLVTWRQLTDGSPPDAAKPWIPGAATYVDKTVSIVFVPESRRDMELLRLMKGSDVPMGNLVGYMAATDFTPKIKDIVIRDSVTMGVAAIDTIAPNGEIILYELRFAA